MSDGWPSEAGLLVLAARVDAGLSQRQLAARAGTSGATIAAYERGTKEPRLSTLRRLVEATGARLDVGWAPVDDAGTLTREERRSLALHRSIAARLAADPEGVLTRARKNLRMMRRANDDGSAEPWFTEWERLLRGSISGVIEALVSRDERARDLRQVTPFAGVLTDAERRAAYRGEQVA
jgi:transcriptional regulator with XRE-family HTH domain